MKKKTVKKLSKAKKETYHLLFYVLNTEPKVKKFKTTAEMGKFIDDFNKEWPQSECSISGSWTDLAVTEVNGEIHFFTDGVELEE
jgi:hypothetical protein